MFISTDQEGRTHFPGHGDIDTDSYLAFLIIKNKRERLGKIELYPFKKVI